MLSILGQLHVEFKEYPKLDKSLNDIFMRDIGVYYTPISQTIDLDDLESAYKKVVFELDKFAVFINKYVIRETTMEFVSTTLKMMHGYYFDRNGEAYRLDYTPTRSEILYMPDYMRLLRQMGIKTKGYLQSPVGKHVGVKQG